jgi:hypothetical protein
VFVLPVRTVFGILVSIVGLLLLLYSGFNFNNLFFSANLLFKSDIPTYNQFVVTPFLLGLLALVDGSIVLSLKRAFSLSIHLLGNFAWIYALYMLYNNLAIPVTTVHAYRQIFILAFLGLIFFVIGVIANDIPKAERR